MNDSSSFTPNKPIATHGLLLTRQKLNSSSKMSSSVEPSKLSNDDANSIDSNEIAAGGLGETNSTVVNDTETKQSESNVIEAENNNEQISPLNNDGIIENNKSVEVYHSNDTPPNTSARKSSTVSINRFSSAQPSPSALQPYIINDVDEGKKQDGIDVSTIPSNSTSLPTTEIADAKILENMAISNSTVVDSRMVDQSTESTERDGEIVVAKDDSGNKTNKSILKKWKRKVKSSVKKAIRIPRNNR